MSIIIGMYLNLLCTFVSIGYIITYKNPLYYIHLLFFALRLVLYACPATGSNVLLSRNTSFTTS